MASRYSPTIQNPTAHVSVQLYTGANFDTVQFYDCRFESTLRINA